MGIWKQRIEGSWLRCSGGSKFSIVNLNGTPKGNMIQAISLKHQAIDLAYVGTINNTSNAGYGNLSDLNQAIGSANDATFTSGLMYDGIGLSGTQSGTSQEYSYIIDYYFDSITSTKKFLASKNYQFKTHVLNYAYINRPDGTIYSPATGTNISGAPSYTIKQTNGKVYYSNMNIFRGALGIDTTWGDLHYFDVPYYKSASTSGGGLRNSDNGVYNYTNPNMPSTYALYYYSSPKSDADSGFVAYTNKLRKSAAVSGILIAKTQSRTVFEAGYGITGVDVNEIGWKIQGYSFVSYDNTPDLGTIGGQQILSITNSYAYFSGSNLVRTPLKYCTLGKGWYYDDENNEYTWYDRVYNDAELDAKNNPVGGDAGMQDTNAGYRENNYIAKYIPFQKFNLSFLYENLRTDSGIKIYLSPTLPSSKPLESSKYSGALQYPKKYVTGTDPNYLSARSKGMRFSLVGTTDQLNYTYIKTDVDSNGNVTGTSSYNAPLSNGKRPNVYVPLTQLPVGGGFLGVLFNNNATLNANLPVFGTSSTIIQDYPAEPLVNHIYVDDDSTNLKEIRVNITLRHTYIADMIINLKVPNGNVINIKAKYSGEFFNDLRNITFTTNTDTLRMQDYTVWRNAKADWWPNNWGFKDGKGDIEDPIGIGNTPIPTSQTPIGAVTAPWLPAPYGQGTVNYNFSWAQLKIKNGLTFQMDKNNGQGTTVAGKSYRSNVNDLKYLSNPDNTFLGTYSLYIKDDWGGDSGLLESWSIEFFYKKVFTPILALTQSDPDNAVYKGAAKLQYLFGLEGNQYLFIKGDMVDKLQDPGQPIVPGTNQPKALKYLQASLKNLKIDGGYHEANNKQYRVNDKKFGDNSNPEPTTVNPQSSVGVVGNPDDAGASTGQAPASTPMSQGSGGDNTFALMATVSNVSYSTYVGSGNLNIPDKLSISAVNAKIGNGAFKAGIWENGAWNSGWRYDDTLREFHAIDDFFNYNRAKTWRFSIFGSSYSASSFSTGDKVSIGNICAIDINGERKLIKGYFTIMGVGADSITVEFESDFPIRRIAVDSEIHRIYVTKNVWLNGGFFNGYFRGVWNSGLLQGFPYITEMFNTHWIDGRINGGHFHSRKKSNSFNGTYIATTDRIKVGLIFPNRHGFGLGDKLTISATASAFGSTKVIRVDDDYRLVVDINWDDSKRDVSGTAYTNISTGLIQNLTLDTNNVSTTTSLQSMESNKVFMYNSWIDVNFDPTIGVNIGKPQSTIDNTVSKYSYSDNNLYGYPTFDVLASDTTFRDSFSTTIRKYRLGSKYKIYEDYIGNAGDFDEHFDVTGWATRKGLYRKNTFPFFDLKNIGDSLPASAEFSEQGWVLNRITATGSAINAERTIEAQDEDDVAAGKEMRIEAIGRGGVLDIMPAYDVPNRTNSPIEKQRYTMIKFDLLSALVPDNIFEEPNQKIFDSSSRYQPIIHFNNLNIVTRKQFVQGTGYVQKKIDATYLPVYKNINHIDTSSKTKVEFFYNKKNLSMFFRGNGLDGENTSTMVIDNLRLYEIDMIPFFQYFTEGNINRSVSVPYYAVAPVVEYAEGDSAGIEQSLYGPDSFVITQPSGEVTIQAESAAAAAAAAADSDPAINTAVNNSGGLQTQYQAASANIGFELS